MQRRRIRFAAALGLCLVLATSSEIGASDIQPATELPENVARALLIAGAKAAAGDLAGALPYYRFAHEADPQNVHLALRAADTALELGQAKDALRFLERTAEFHPGDLELGSLQVHLLLSLGELVEAESVAQRLLAQSPDDVTALELQAGVLERKGDIPAALALYERLLERLGPDARRLERMAYLALRSGDRDGAREFARRSLRLDPSAAGPLELLAAAIADPAELETELRALLNEDADTVGLRSALADLLLARGDSAEAVEILLPLEQRGELGRGPSMVLAELLMRLGREAEAQQIVERLFSQSTPEAALHRLAGELAQRRGELDLAMEHLDLALAAAPDDIECHLAWLLAEGQRHSVVFDENAPPSEVRNRFNRVLTRAAELSEEPSLRHDYLIGTLMRRVGRFGEAVPRLSRAHEQDAESDEILYDLAVCYEELDRESETKAALEQLLVLQPDVPHYQNFLGYFLAERGEELDRAEALIRRALEAEPTNAYYLDSLGWVQFQLGEYETAYATLRSAQTQGLEEDPTVSEHVAEALFALRRPQEALEEFQRAIEREGDRERLQARIDEIEKSLREQP